MVVYDMTSEEFTSLLKENEVLKEKLDKYENPEDMTLFAMWCTEKVKDENKELKEKVRAVNKGLRKVQERSIKYKNRCFELNKKIYELEEQLEDMTLCRDIASGHRKEVQDRETILLNQQKEFIKYLEDEIERLKENDIYQPLQRTALITHEHDLQKYKEIIGE